ncbi:MAG: MFS transporter [Pseudomonadota bacterium]
MTAVTLAAVFFAALASLTITLVTFANGLRPLLFEKVEAVAEATAADIEFAVSLGIPAESIVGLDSFVADIVERSPELAEMSVSFDPAPRAQDADLRYGPNDPFGAVANAFGVFFGQELDLVEAAIRRGDQTVGYLVAQPDNGFIRSKLRDVFFDTFVILLVSALVAYEVVVVQVTSSVHRPLAIVEEQIRRRREGDFSLFTGTATNNPQIERIYDRINELHASVRERTRKLLLQANQTVRDQVEAVRDKARLEQNQESRWVSILDARVPLFIFCFAEELQKSFLPLFVAELWTPDDLFDRSVMIGLPISVFMFTIAVITPFAGVLIDRVGTRKMFLWGLIPAVLGYFICYYATSSDHIVIGRGVTAIGYAVITISSQSYIIEAAFGKNRAQAMAVFVGVLMTATMCGTAIGGILADWVGYQPVFLISAGLATVAGLLALATLRTFRPNEVQPDGTSTKNSSGKSQTWLLLTNARYVCIIIFCAIPAKVILTGVFYLMVPIYLASFGSSQSEIGRIMMLYSLLIIPMSPLASRLCDRLGQNLGFVIGATVASGIVLMLMYQNTTLGGVVLMVGALGVAHAFLKAPLIVSAVEAAERIPNVSRTVAMSLLRTSERIGSVIGPILVSALLVSYSFEWTAAIIGTSVVAMGIIMVLLVGARLMTKSKPLDA